MRTSPQQQRLPNGEMTIVAVRQRHFTAVDEHNGIDQCVLPPNRAGCIVIPLRGKMREEYLGVIKRLEETLTLERRKAQLAAQSEGARQLTFGGGARRDDGENGGAL